MSWKWYNKQPTDWEKVKSMVYCYDKLWKLLIDRHMTKTQMRLAVGLSTVTLARMNKNLKIHQATLKRICDTLECKPTDVLVVKKKAKEDSAE